MMITPLINIPHSPTFETIITKRIDTNCPRLEATENTDPDPDATNFYLHSTVFRIVFEVVSDKRQLNLRVKQTFLNNILELIHGSGSTIARGDEHSMMKLKSILEELISNEHIRSIVIRYHDLKKQLDNDPNYVQFKNVVN